MPRAARQQQAPPANAPRRAYEAHHDNEDDQPQDNDKGADEARDNEEKLEYGNGAYVRAAGTVMYRVSVFLYREFCPTVPLPMVAPAQ